MYPYNPFVRMWYGIVCEKSYLRKSIDVDYRPFLIAEKTIKHWKQDDFDAKLKLFMIDSKVYSTDDSNIDDFNFFFEHSTVNT
jgi:hypothetical protein